MDHSFVTCWRKSFIFSPVERAVICTSPPIAMAGRKGLFKAVLGPMLSSTTRTRIESQPHTTEMSTFYFLSIMMAAFVTVSRFWWWRPTLRGRYHITHKLGVYAGKERSVPRLPAEPDCGRSGNVAQFSRMIPRGVRHKVYSGNYFNCPSLQVYLEWEALHCIGTVRINRVPGVSMPSEQEMKKTKTTF